MPKWLVDARYRLLPDYLEMTVKPPAKSYKTFLFQNCSKCSEAREKDFSYFYAINFQIDNEPRKSFALYFID